MEMRAILIKTVTLLTLVILFTPVILSHEGTFDYLRTLTTDEYDPDILMEEEVEYVESLLFEPITFVLPGLLQKELLENEYNNLEDIIQRLQYTNLWQLEYAEFDIWGNLKLYKIIRGEFLPPRFVAGVLYNKSSGEYSIIGIGEMSLELFNQKTKVVLSTANEAISYAKEAIRLIKSYIYIYDSIPSPEHFWYVESLKDTITGPQILFHHHSYYVMEMFAVKYIRALGMKVDKLIVTVSRNGEIAMLSEAMN